MVHCSLVKSWRWMDCVSVFRISVSLLASRELLYTCLVVCCIASACMFIRLSDWSIYSSVHTKRRVAWLQYMRQPSCYLFIVDKNTTHERIGYLISNHFALTWLNERLLRWMFQWWISVYWYRLPNTFQWDCVLGSWYEIPFTIIYQLKLRHRFVIHIVPYEMQFSLYSYD